MNPVVYYCYDAYCGWCYGFSPVITRLAETYKDRLSFEVLSGGMIPAENPRPVSAMAGYIAEAYKRVEEMTGVKFGQDYLWHIFNPGLSDWFPHSEKAAIALCIAREYQPARQVAFAADLQKALHEEGRDLTDDEAYRHLLPAYGIPEEDFYHKLHEEAYREKAHYDFALCRQLQVTGFPALLLQESESRFYLLTRGYAPYEEVSARLEKVLEEIKVRAGG